MTFEDETTSRLVGEFRGSIAVKERVLESSIPVLNEIVAVMKDSLLNGNKLMLFGNGGSAADAQHIAAEFVSKFNHDRQALPAMALTTDTSILTSISNDYEYARVFARQIEALGRAGDVALGISTSGNSPNVIMALQQAREMGLKTVGFTGQDGGRLTDEADYCFRVPSNSTPRIQEVHITAAHAICGILELELCATTVTNGAVQ